MSDNAGSTIVNELLSKPSAVTPTLFVGLGGAGCKIVNRIYQHVKARHDYDERFRSLAQFAYLDTNLHDLAKFRAEGAADLFLISDFEKAEYSKLAAGKAYLDADDYFTQWVPNDYRFRTGDTAGAGQIRIESRLGMYYQVKHKDFVQRFRRLIEKLKDHSHGHRQLDNQEIRIVIAYSVAGGTGSGSHLPMSYLLRELASQYGKPIVFGVAALSSVFEDKVGTNKDGVFANGYAALKETEYLMKLGAPESKFFPENGRRTFHYNPLDPTHRTVDAKPFDTLWIIDRPESFHVDDVLSAAGDAMYLQLFTPIYGEQAGDFDNYTQHQRFLVPHDFENKGIPGYTAFYGGIGAAVLHVPDRSILEYCSKRGGLGVIESSFLQGVPGGAAYASVASNPDSFNEVSDLDGKGRPVKELDFVKRSKQDREQLANKLFQKRVRLLAFAEQETGGDITFFRDAMKHGDSNRALPLKDGSLRAPEMAAEGKSLAQADADLSRWSNDILGAKLLQVSMAHFALNALAAPSNAKDSTTSVLVESVIDTLTKKAKSESGNFIAEKSAEEPPEESGWKRLTGGGQPSQPEVSPAEIEETVSRIRGELNGQIVKLLDRPEEMRPSRADWIPGLAWIDAGSFLTSAGAAEQNLIAKRYAVLAVLDRVTSILAGYAKKATTDGKTRSDSEARAAKDAPPGPEADSDSGNLVGEHAIRARVDTLMKSVISGLRDAVHEQFRRRLQEVQKKLAAYAGVFTTLQEQYGPLRERQEAAAEQLRRNGSVVDTEKFVLDGEALQIESKRRLWDFYFEDQVRYLPELQVSSNELLADTLSEQIQRLVDGQMRGESIPADALESIYKAVSGTISKSLNNAIVGDPRSKSEAERHGLTLHRALELEVRYRALYLSNRAAIDAGGTSGVASLMASVRGGRDNFNVKDPIHLDYFKDKLKRLIKERSDLICYLDEKHLSQGGTRPDEIFLATVHEDLHKGLLKETLGESLGMRPPRVIEKGVEDRKTVIFYRAILNVPLYVFGRMRDLRAAYHQFKGMARRPKVLHIDKNWEDTLPDLDPAVVEEQHRQLTIRNSVLGFAALLSAGLSEVDQSLQGDGGSHSDDDREEAVRRARMREEAIASLKAGGGDRCLVWRAAAQSGRRLGDVGSNETARNWVLRMPLQVRMDLARDGQSWDQIDAAETVLGTLMSESILQVQKALEESPTTYKQYETLLRWVRLGQAPIVFERITKVPAEWQRHYESLRNRYGRNPTEAQQRQLSDIQSVYTKLAAALIDLLEELDLRQREESGLISKTLAGTAAPSDDDDATAADRLKDTIRILQDFKREWTGADRRAPTATGSLFGRAKPKN
jgi:hypothetical protein